MVISKSQQQELTKLRNSGSGELGVGLNESKLNYLLSLIARDLNKGEDFPELPNDIPSVFDKVDPFELFVEGLNFDSLYERLLKLETEADTYLFCLGSLLKAKLKYERILRSQPIPTVEQVGPRSLLQFGQLQTPALAALLFWRKWIFDIDNRAGQETGYLFEPIMARSIGGVPYGAKNSPVRRDGAGTGRQVDCIVESNDNERRAYELKLRVTIAASGQGRWDEELSFPNDCKKSGFKPVLIVFDDTENEKLTTLRKQFEEFGGKTHIGPGAWLHLEQKAGPTMSKFLENYVRQPIKEVLEQAPDQLPQVTFKMDEAQLSISVGDEHLSIKRDDLATSISAESTEAAEQTSLFIDESHE